jgi:UDP-2-acetamido-3-amino-2,3-dideoxy-glucuronate N-acetyltransferase
MQAKLIDVESFSDYRGSLIVGEYPKTLPFEPVRFFVVSGVPAGESRGNHAHKTNMQFLMCLVGSVVVKVNDGTRVTEFILEPGPRGLFIPAMNWAEQRYETPDTQLIVLASEAYVADEYIVDICEFKDRLSTPS